MPPPAPLSDSALDEALINLPDWERDGNHIRADFTFVSFVMAFAFMTEMAFAAERLNHHPEWSNVYNRVSVGLTTHESSGVTASDIELATAMSTAAGRNK